jgi:hypothetical protein
LWLGDLFKDNIIYRNTCRGWTHPVVGHYIIIGRMSFSKFMAEDILSMAKRKRKNGKNCGQQNSWPTMTRSLRLKRKKSEKIYEKNRKKTQTKKLIVV